YTVTVTNLSDRELQEASQVPADLYFVQNGKIKGTAYGMVLPGSGVAGDVTTMEYELPHLAPGQSDQQIQVIRDVYSCDYGKLPAGTYTVLTKQSITDMSYYYAYATSPGSGGEAEARAYADQKLALQGKSSTDVGVIEPDMASYPVETNPRVLEQWTPLG